MLKTHTVNNGIIIILGGNTIVSFRGKRPIFRGALLVWGSVPSKQMVTCLISSLLSLLTGGNPLLDIYKIVNRWWTYEAMKIKDGNMFLAHFFELHMDVSENRCTPKSSILIGFSFIDHPFWGIPIFGNTHMFTSLSGNAPLSGRKMQSCCGPTCPMPSPMMRAWM